MNKAYHLNKDFDLNLDSSSNITLFVEINTINISYNLANGIYNILVFNNSNSDVKINEDGHITNGTVNITYIELNEYKFNQINCIEVNKDSSLNINSIYLGIDTKNIKFDIYNSGINSNVYINNNVVCLNDADFELAIIGNIKKGAKNSKCHQKSQCLTFESPKIAKVLPVLNIDENDVEASHSLSSGTIDEEVLFYMNSRGLNRKESLALLLVSYLIPDDEFYKGFVEGDLINSLTKEKVNKACSL